MRTIKEEYNRLIKVKLFQQGTNQWRLLPVSKKDGSEIRRKDITFRGADDKLILLLRRLKAKDAATDPPSAKNRTYQQMIDTAKDKSDPFIWVWLTVWNNYKDGKKIVNYEANNKKYITIEKDLLLPGTDILIEAGDTIHIVENQREDLIKAQSLLDTYAQNNNNDPKKVHQAILDNIVNSEYNHFSNSFVDLMWDLYNQKY